MHSGGCPRACVPPRWRFAGAPSKSSEHSEAATGHAVHEVSWGTTPLPHRPALAARRHARDRRADDAAGGAGRDAAAIHGIGLSKQSPARCGAGASQGHRRGGAARQIGFPAANQRQPRCRPPASRLGPQDDRGRRDKPVGLCADSDAIRVQRISHRPCRERGRGDGARRPRNPALGRAAGAARGRDRLLRCGARQRAGAAARGARRRSIAGSLRASGSGAPFAR